MNLDRLNQWLMLIANLGVITGIGVLAWEIRQNTLSQEAAAYQDLIGRIVDLNQAAVNDPEQADLMVKAADGVEMSRNESMRYYIFIVNWMRHGDMAYFQFEQGFISEERLRSALAPLQSLLANPGAKAAFARAKVQGAFSDEYMDYLEEFLTASTVTE